MGLKILGCGTCATTEGLTASIGIAKVAHVFLVYLVSDGWLLLGALLVRVKRPLWSLATC